MDLSAMLKILATQDGSDLYLSTGAPPCAKFNGVLKPLSNEPLKPGDVAAIAAGVMDAEQRADFEHAADDAARTELRTLLGLPADAPLAAWLDIG